MTALAGSLTDHSFAQWPYSYDTCDVGTVKNQSYGGVPDNPDGFSYLSGQKLSRCTCPGSNHPGPVHDDGTYVGRSAPEIDVFEASVVRINIPVRELDIHVIFVVAQSTGGIGQVSQSAQWAVRELSLSLRG